MIFHSYVSLPEGKSDMMGIEWDKMAGPVGWKTNILEISNSQGQTLRWEDGT
jgi:hypothetical protein